MPIMLSAMRLMSGDDVSPDARKGSGLPAANTNLRRNGTVIVVEADVLVRLATAESLRDAGFRVIETGTGEEARDALQAGEAATAIFADIDLPGMWQGTHLAAWTRTHFPKVKIILTSGAFHTVAGLRSCDRFVPKPYQPREIAEQVRAVIGA
jgi:DNA-binding response OmpR family regulator